VTRAILVTDGDERSALAVVRSLGNAGHKVYVCSTSGRSIAGASRHASGERMVSPSLTNPDAFARELASLISLWRIDVLLPMTEQAFNAVFANPELFLTVLIPAASPDKFRAISDKRLVTEAAAACGLSVPAQIVLTTPADAAALLDADLHFPMVVKPGRSLIFAESEVFALLGQQRVLVAKLSATLAVVQPT